MLSQIEYWMMGNPPIPPKNSEGNEYTLYLSYDIFRILTVVGGYIGLDHLYLRSPLTGIAKAIVNIFFCGAWWIHDILHAIFNKDIVRVFGLGVPGLGPKGIAAGVLANDIPDKLHWNFFIYGAALCFGGLFGIDLFVVDNKLIGFIHFILAISVILTPVALIFWAYRSFCFLFDTKQVIGDNHKFFGGHPSADKSMIVKLEEWITNKIYMIFGPIIMPIMMSLNAVKESIDGVVNLGNNALNTSQAVINGVTSVIEVATKASPILPGVSLYSSITPETVAAAQKRSLDKEAEKGIAKVIGGSAAAIGMAGMAGMTGVTSIAESVTSLGDSLNITHYLLIGTIVLIAVSGIVVTYYRSKKDDFTNQSKQNDVPPEPRVFRKSDSKRSST